MKVPLGKSSLVGLVVAVLAMAMAAPASARDIHYLSSTFGAGELSLEERSGIVYDKEIEDIDIADTGHGRVVRYSADGEPLGVLANVTEPTFLALDTSSGGSSGDIYVGQGREAIVKLDSSGTPISSWGTGGRMEGFGEIAGISVDPSGNLFVLGTDFVLHELSPSGSQTNQCTAPYQVGSFNGTPVENKVSPSGIAADAEGDLYFAVLEPGQGGIFPHVALTDSGCGKVRGQVNPNEHESVSVSVDEVDNSVFVAKRESGRVGHYAADGEPIGGGGPSGIGVFGYEEGVEQNGQLAVRSDDETVYVNDTEKDDVAVYTVGNVEPPQVKFLAPTEVTPTSARLRATINPGAPAGNLPAFGVEYQLQCLNLTAEEPENSLSVCGGNALVGKVPSGSEPVVVEGKVESLLPASEYAVYITVQNAAYLQFRIPTNPKESTTRFRTGAIAPSIEEAAVTEASESLASVSAVINPHGAETGYWIEYVTRPQFEGSGFAAAARTPEQFIPVGIKGVPISAALSGLAGSTSYVVRVVATNTIEGSVETVASEPVGFMTREPSLPPVSGGCLNDVFRSGPSGALPDCRAYEQSTPADKNGGGPAALPGQLQATEGPDGITFFSQAGIPGGVGAQDYPSFLSSRGEGAWSTQGLLPPAALGSQAGYLGLTPGGRYAISEAGKFNEGEKGKYGVGVFERDLQTGETTTIVPYETECTALTCFFFAGANADGSRVFIETKMQLTKGKAGEETHAGQMNLFLWERGSGQISLVDMSESDAPLPEGGFAGPYFWPEGENFSTGPVSVGGASAGLYTQPIHAVSQDGSQVVYTERAMNEKGQGLGQLYVRVGLGGPSPTTVKVSTYQEGKEGPEFPAAFLEATSSGRYIFFKTESELTSDAYSGSGTESLYRYDVSTGHLIDITSEAKKKFADGPGVQGLIGTSESGNVAYFVANAALTTAAGPNGKTAQSGEANLYRWEEGAATSIKFIATLEGGRLADVGNDAVDWSPAPENGGGEYPKAGRVAADGSALVFSSRRALTGVQNLSKQCNDRNTGRGPCAEFFRYSAATGTLDCISCDPTGVQPLGSATIGTPFIDAEDLPTAYATPVLSKNLSANGDRFFFQTPDPLVPADVNASSGCQFGAEERATCMDVYEWEAPGSGSCPSTVAAPSGGCVYLISSGDKPEASYFADADREGGNVYFMTSSQLVPADRDQLYDIYDAREDGGLASQNQVATVPCVSRQACQGSQATSEAGATPGTSTFSGPENPKPATTCKKGFVKRHGKCVKKSKNKKKKHTKKKHTKKKHAAKTGGKRRAGDGRRGEK